MEKEKKKELELLAVEAREHILKAIHSSGTGHPGGSLSAIDFLTYLYQEVIRVNPKEPRDPDRDRFVLSKGHVVPALYTTLALKGFFPVEDLLTLRKADSYLQGHPNMNMTPGIDMSTGSLGQGISAAAGMAKAAAFIGKDIHVYTLVGDGETQEGQVWEAVTFAAHYQLDRLCIAVDVNGLQIDGTTKEVMNVEPLDQKFEAFGCHVITVNGHDFEELEQAFNKFHQNIGSKKPTVILMKTVKGKDVSFMENNAAWHGKAPDDAQLAQAMKELEAKRAGIMEE
ncbi:MAG: transketolase [Eubacterium sp.]|nr:transketolase [Eubacterium sp.]